MKSTREQSCSRILVIITVTETLQSPSKLFLVGPRDKPFPPPTNASFSLQHDRHVTFLKQKLCVHPLCDSPALRLLWIYKKDSVESTEDGQMSVLPPTISWTQLI